MTFSNDRTVTLVALTRARCVRLNKSVDDQTDRPGHLAETGVIFPNMKRTGNKEPPKV